jgi:hypothetical protein
MLYLLNDQGVPSVAKWLKLDEQDGSLGGCGSSPPPDTQNPTVTLHEPQAGTVAGTIDVRATASDDRGVARVDFTVDGDPLDTELGSHYKASWNTVASGDGQHTVTATAHDQAGKTGTATVTVTVQNTDVQAPDVNITSPVAGATVGGSTNITANADDNGGSGVASVQFKVGDTNIGAADTTAPYSVPWQTINVANGNHTLTAVARDLRNIPATSAGVTVNVHNDDGDKANALPPKKTPQGGGSETGGGGETTPGGGGTTTTPGNVAPALRKLKLSPASFRKGQLTTISFRLSEAAKVVLSFERKLSGRRSRGRCVKLRKEVRPNCTRFVRVSGQLTVQGKAGANSVGFRGRVSRKRALPAGSYRLTLVAKDKSGDWSTAVSAGFRLMESASAAQARAVRAIVLGWL